METSKHHVVYGHYRGVIQAKHGGSETTGQTHNYDFTPMVLVQILNSGMMFHNLKTDQKRSSRVGMRRVEPPLQGLCQIVAINTRILLSQCNGMISDNEPGKSTERTAHTEVVSWASWANDQAHCRGDTVERCREFMT